MSLRVTGTVGSLNAFSPTFSNDGGAGFGVVVTGVFVGTLDLQWSPDAGANWLVVRGDQMSPINFTAPRRQWIGEMELGGIYRLQMTSYTSGTATVRFFQ